jgi:endonuclease III
VVSLSQQLDVLGRLHGRQQPLWPLDPYRFLIWWHCGYPPSDAACARGWTELTALLDPAPAALAAADERRLARALKSGGLVPEVRAGRIRHIAATVMTEFGGDLGQALRALAPPQARRILKRFPGIGDPGADRIILFAALAPLAAVPSNATQVAVRLRHGASLGSYPQDYRAGQALIEETVAATVAQRQRAFLLLKVHGETVCRRSTPRCDACPLVAGCVYGRGARRAGPAMKRASPPAAKRS